jgi:heterodisulfide reductase subunit A
MGSGTGGGMGRNFSSNAPIKAIIDEAKCTGCKLCVQACPFGAITVDDVAHVDIAKCNGCGQCVSACPVNAIAMR